MREEKGGKERREGRRERGRKERGGVGRGEEGISQCNVQDRCHTYLARTWACGLPKAQTLKCDSSVQPGEIHIGCSKGFNKARADWIPRIITTKDHFVVFVAI